MRRTEAVNITVGNLKPSKVRREKCKKHVMLSRHVLTITETIKFARRPNGLMDKASASGAGNCGFKSHLCCKPYVEIVENLISSTYQI